MHGVKKCTLLINKTRSRTVLLYLLQYVFELRNNQLVWIFRRSLRLIFSTLMLTKRGYGIKPSKRKNQSK